MRLVFAGSIGLLCAAGVAPDASRAEGCLPGMCLQRSNALSRSPAMPGPQQPGQFMLKPRLSPGPSLGIGTNASPRLSSPGRGPGTPRGTTSPGSSPFASNLTPEKPRPTGASSPIAPSLVSRQTRSVRLVPPHRRISPIAPHRRRPFVFPRYRQIRLGLSVPRLPDPRHRSEGRSAVPVQSHPRVPSIPVLPLGRRAYRRRAPLRRLTSARAVEVLPRRRMRTDLVPLRPLRTLRAMRAPLCRQMQIRLLPRPPRPRRLARLPTSLCAVSTT